MRKGELNISEKTYAAFIKLAGYQIIGGLLGIAFIIWFLFELPEIEIGTILVMILISLFFLYSLFCGIKCIQAKKNALRHSLINQCMQIFGIAVFGFAFKYIAGVYLNIGFDVTDDFNLKFGAGLSTCDIWLNTKTGTSVFTINFIAIGIIIWIDKLIKKVKSEMDVDKTEEIGIDITPQSIEN